MTLTTYRFKLVVIVRAEDDASANLQGKKIHNQVEDLIIQQNLEIESTSWGAEEYD